MNIINLFFKRAIDITLSGLGLLILSPLMLIVFISIKLTSPGSAIYAQTRVGLNRQLFKIYKFRSMVVNADQIDSSVTKKDDNRITPTGKIIRRTKLDELPQLWNVFIGDMSLVGPRPDVPEIISLYTSEMLRILEIKPGITSIASLHLRAEDNLLGIAKYPDKAYKEIILPAKVNLDMIHVEKPSILFDIWILIQTVAVLFVSRVYTIPEHPILTQLRQLIISTHNEVS
jgi:lipopolysaccharide/colanic/teichoic acid biosynthesis glycosyltransferase